MSGNPASEHSGVVNVGMLDGSVRSISDKISQVNWNRAVTPNDGQPPEIDW